jgi:hypothetical protein
LDVKTDEVAGDWRSVHNVELHNPHASINTKVPNQGGQNKWVMQHARKKKETDTKLYSRNLKNIYNFKELGG